MTKKYNGTMADALNAMLEDKVIEVVQAAKLKTAARDALPDSDFAVPGKRVMPINDREHVIKAWQLKDTAEGLSAEELAEARKRIISRAKKFGIDTSDWEGMKASAFDQPFIGKTFIAGAMQLEAANLDKEHVNKLHGTGVLTKLDEPSDAPLGGSGGRRVILPTAVARAALKTLINMPLNYSNDFDAHERTQIVGAITAAAIVGNEIKIEFDLYAFNHPDTVKQIQAQKQEMGFSYELADVRCVEDKVNNVLIVESCTFTGAAILYKNKAAYKTTSLNANEEIEMTKELLEQNAELVAALKTLTEDVKELKAAAKQTDQPKGRTAGTMDKKGNAKMAMRKSAKRLRRSAREMEAAGIAGDARRGAVATMRNMADRLDDAAAVGVLPEIFLTDDWLGLKAAEDPKLAEKDAEIAELKKQINSTDNKTSFLAASEANRKTYPPAITALLDKNLSASASNSNQKLSVAQIDEALVQANMSTEQSIAIKRQLRAQNII